MATDKPKKDSREKLHAWMNGTRVYVWDAGTVTFRGDECIVFADGLGYREGRSHCSLDALAEALGRYKINHVNPTPTTTAALKSVHAALERIESISEAERDETIPNNVLPGCQTVWL